MTILISSFTMPAEIRGVRRSRVLCRSCRLCRVGELGSVLAQKSNSDPDQVLSAAEVASMIGGISPRTVLRIDRSVLPRRQLSARRIGYRLGDVQAYIVASHSPPAGNPAHFAEDLGGQRNYVPVGQGTTFEAVRFEERAVFLTTLLLVLRSPGAQVVPRPTVICLPLAAERHRELIIVDGDGSAGPEAPILLQPFEDEKIGGASQHKIHKPWSAVRLQPIHHGTDEPDCWLIA